MASKGGFDFNALYNMPLYLRRFYFKLMDEYIIKENERIEQASKPNQAKPKLLGPSGRAM